jgi:hypothetical protein
MTGPPTAVRVSTPLGSPPSEPPLRATAVAETVSVPLAGAGVGDGDLVGDGEVETFVCVGVGDG